jgi:hypothetical protein
MSSPLWEMRWDPTSRSRLLDAPSPSVHEDKGHTLDWWSGQPIRESPLYSSVIHPGRGTDVEYTHRSVLVIPEAAKTILEALESLDAQFVPLIIRGDCEEKFAVNVLSVVPCFDWVKSTYSVWPPTAEPFRVGQPQDVIELRVDRSRAPITPMFRVAEAPSMTIVSSKAKLVFDTLRCSGVEFIEV